MRKSAPKFKWTKEKVERLLELILFETEGDPDRIEKPTHQIFYSNLVKNEPELSDVTWTICDNKIRNLRSDYQKAMKWKQQTGAGLMEDGKQNTVKEYILKICPHFDMLHEIFGQKKSVNPTSVVDSNIQNSNTIIESIQVVQQSSDDFESYEVLDDYSTFDQSNSNEVQLPTSGSHNVPATTVIPPIYRSFVLNSSQSSSVSPTIQSNERSNLQGSTTGSSSGATSPIIPLDETNNEPEIYRNSRKKRASGSLPALMEIQTKRLKLEEEKITKQFEIDLKNQDTLHLKASNEVVMKKWNLSISIK